MSEWNPDGFNPVQMVETTVDGYYIDPLAVDHIIDPKKVPLLHGTLNSPFSKPSYHHGRNMEDPHGVVIKPGHLADENGDIYTTFTIKGADLTLPRASYSTLETSYVSVYGMLDADTFDRCQQVSQHLRENGVLTEWPIFHGRPKAFPGETRDIGLLPFKQQLYESYVWRNELDEANAVGGHITGGIGRAGTIGAGLLDLKFGVMYRAMLSNTRLSESAVLTNEGTFIDHVSSAIQALQVRKPIHFDCWNKLEKLDSADPEDMKLFLKEVLPQIMGENLARFHNTSSYHRFLHPGNWTMAGEIVDLDSVECPDLFEEDGENIETLDRFSDFFESLYSIQSSSKSLELMSRAYARKRLSEGNLPNVETMILEGQFLGTPESMVDLGPPLVARLESEDDTHAREIVEGYILNNALGEFASAEKAQAAWFETFRTQISQQVEDYFQKELGKTMPRWLDMAQITNIELVKLYWQYYCEVAAENAA